MMGRGAGWEGVWKRWDSPSQDLFGGAGRARSLAHGFRGFVRPDEGDARGDEEDWDEGGEGESVSFWRH